MLGAARGIDRLNRLGFRLAALLSIALLPLGLIAVLQTERVIAESRERAEAALMGRTVQAASYEKELIQTAIGAGLAFGAAVRSVRHDRAACSSLFRNFIDASDTFVFAGYIDPAGVMKCTSEGVSMHFADAPIFQDLKSNPRVLARLNTVGPISGEPAVIVTVPVLDGPRFDGAISVSVPHAALLDGVFRASDRPPLDLVTFNAEGEVLLAAGGLDGVIDRLPADRPMAALAQASAASFIARTPAGPERVFTVVPLIEDTVFAVAVWSLDAAPPAQRLITVPSVAIPVLMWLASLGVAYYAVHRLVIRHIRRLRHRIRVFTSARRTLPAAADDELPAELREVSEAFQAMTERIIADETHLESSIHEKNVLLREVHHRVKNNLQLITSMISMQLRQTDAPEMRRQLQRLQDRVRGLAVIHQNLYNASSLSKVRADVLVREIVEQMLVRAVDPAGGIRITRDLVETTLYPDQALPLALLANEAITNALKYLGAPPDGGPWIDVTLVRQDDGQLRLTVANSSGAPVAETLPSDGTGLGTRLIEAFTIQLGGTLTAGETDGTYRLEVVFREVEFDSAVAAPSPVPAR